MAASDRAHAVILAGGRGTRFWPLSRHAHPKQFLDFTGEGNLLALTVQRIAPLVPPERQWILTSEDLAATAREAAPQVPADQVLAEPMGRNTAPAVALAAAMIAARDGDVPFAVLPSDHLIQPGDAFRATLARALELAQEGRRLVTFGVVPDRAETGYGYIETGAPVEGWEGARDVAAFREKPDRPTAETYLAGGRHLWNSGMFAWSTEVVREGLRQHEPAVLEPVEALAREASTPGTEAFQAAFKRAYERVPSISIDYALLERADNVAVLAADFEWNDVGHWLAMRELWPHDDQDNATRGTVVGIDSSRNVVFGPGRLTALVGMEDTIVVHTEDATLVCRADRAQDIKRLLEALKQDELRRYL